jgi:multiple sugar transport system substrate-binding protein
MFTRRQMLRGSLGVAGLVTLGGCTDLVVPSASPTGDGTAPSGSTSPTQPPEQIKLSYWDSNPDPEREELRRGWAARFEAANPNVDVEYVPTSASTFLQKLTTAIGGGKAPDVTDMQGGWLSQYASSGALLDLDPYFADWPLSGDYLSAMAKLGHAFGGKMYWLPTGLFVLAITYRADWVEEAGIKSPLEHYKEGTWTWEAFQEVAKALNRPTENRYGFTLRGGFGGERNLFNVIMSYTGGKWFEEDGTCVLDFPEALEAVSWYTDLLLKHQLTPASAPGDGYREILGNFSSGVVGMLMHSTDPLPDQRNQFGIDAVRVVPLPAGPTGSWQQLDGLGTAVLAQTDHPETAAKFAFSTMVPEDFDKVIEANIAAGKPPFSTSVDLSFESLFERKAYLEDPDMWAFWAVAREGEKVYTNPFYLPEYTSIVNSLVLPQFQGILTGQMSVKQATSDWAAAFTEAQQSFLARPTDL